ncbi:MAG: decarboxylase [Burkholderiales bacterium]|nr:decarboxylase [Burkholderiales bacterium]
MAESPIDRIAAELVRLHAQGGDVAPFSERYADLTPEDGYRAAARLHAHRVAQGWRPVGRKIGFTNRTIWKRYGVYEPMWGMVYDRTLVTSKDARARVSLDGLVQPRIEPEICFRIASVPPREARDPHALLAAIDWVAHAIEIVQCHHPGWRLRIADCTADNGLHGRLVVGTPVPIGELPDLSDRLPALEVTLRRGARVVDHGVGANVLDSPLNALAFLVDVLAKQPEAPPLAAGEIITTGVLTDAHPVAPGETWSTAFEGLPLAGLEVSFE